MQTWSKGINSYFLIFLKQKNPVIILEKRSDHNKKKLIKAGWTRSKRIIKGTFLTMTHCRCQRMVHNGFKSCGYFGNHHCRLSLLKPIFGCRSYSNGCWDVRYAVKKHSFLRRCAVTDKCSRKMMTALFCFFSLLSKVIFLIAISSKTRYYSSSFSQVSTKEGWPILSSLAILR